MTALNSMELCFLMRDLSQKDHLTFIHSYRVTELAVSFASYISLPREEVRRIELGALLHDIGKLRIDETILTKQGKLEAEEFLQVKYHTLYGLEVLERFTIPDAVLHMALYHHERWDGAGYPAGRRGETIPYYARLLCIMDSLEAMTGERPYRKARSWQEAAKEIASGRGTQFDPELTDLCLQWMKESPLTLASDPLDMYRSIAKIKT